MGKWRSKKTNSNDWYFPMKSFLENSTPEEILALIEPAMAYAEENNLIATSGSEHKQTEIAKKYIKSLKEITNDK